MLAPGYFLCFTQCQLPLSWNSTAKHREVPSLSMEMVPFISVTKTKLVGPTLSASLPGFPISSWKTNSWCSRDVQDTNTLGEGFDCLMSQLLGTETTAVPWHLRTSTVPNPLLSSRQHCCFLSPPVCYSRALLAAGCRGWINDSTRLGCTALQEGWGGSVHPESSTIRWRLRERS